MNSKTLTLLGFAAKAGKLSFGMDSVKTAVKQGKSRLIVVSIDISAKSLKEVKFLAADNIQVLIIDVNMETLSHAVGKKCGIISVNDKGFKESILNLN